MLAWTLACGDPAPCASDVPACGDAGLALLAAPAAAAELRYNAVLQAELVRLHLAVGQYVDGSVSVYRGSVAFHREAQSWVSEQPSVLSGDGEVYAILVDDEPSIDGPERVPVRALNLYVPASDYRLGLAQDARSEGTPLHATGFGWVPCTGEHPSLLAEPGHLVLRGVVCDRDDAEGRLHLEIDADLERLPAGTVTHDDLVQLRRVAVPWALPPLSGEEEPCSGALVESRRGAHRLSVEGLCHTDVDYEVVSFVRTECVATHGVLSLDLGEVRRCCCHPYHCHPDEEECRTIEP